MASTSMPSIPSVPLISARPSFSASSTGAIPCRLQRGPRPVRSEPSRTRTGPSPITASAQCASGARSPEQPSEPNSCTTGVMPGVEHRRVRLRRLRADPGAAGGQRGQPEQHQRPHDLALDLGARTGRVRADQAALQLGPLLAPGCARVASAPNPVDTP